jgi:hypothetical protein
MMCFSRIAYCESDNGANDHGVDYAFLSLITLSPDFAAANYTIENEDGSDVNIRITRLPYHFDLIKNEISDLQLEIAIAYQRTKEVVYTFPVADEYIDSKWETYGAGIGLLYEHHLSEHLLFTPSLRLGVTRTENHAIYNGTLTNAFKDLYEGTVFNWKTNSSILNLGLGLKYKWKLLDRSSSITANVYHMIINSFSESNEAVKFNANANSLSINADMVFPTDVIFLEDRIDFVLLLGANNYFGENRNTLGYTTSYQGGLGVEHPIKFGQKKYGYLSVSGQLLFAHNMNGWLLTIGYNSE